MANKVNRLLQDRINKLTDNELEELGKSYVGKYAFVLFDRNFNVSKVKSYEFYRWYPNGLPEDLPDRDRYKGDKTILFNLENGESWELVDIATIGDQINVREPNDNLYLNHTITYLDWGIMKISDGRFFNIPISRKSFITPMLMNIGLFNSGGTTSTQSPTRTLKVGDKFRLKGFGYNEDDTFVVEKIDGNEVTLNTLGVNKPFIWSKFLNETKKMIEDGIIIFQDDVVESETIEPTQIDLEGDFIGKFLNKNAADLLELEKNNRPLFDVVEMTLNMLSKKFGGGENIAEKVDEVIEHSDELIKAVKEKNANTIPLIDIRILSNEGGVDLTGKVYNSWTEFNDALKILYDPNMSGYNKVKFKVIWEDGSGITDRVDVGVTDFNPNIQKVGQYIDRPFFFDDSLKEEPDNYEWDDEVVVMEGGEDPTSYDKEDFENEIKSLEIILMYEEDQDKIDELTEKIEALKISLSQL
jgi:hypothetical protein